jgi:hypothetical protein
MEIVELIEMVQRGKLTPAQAAETGRTERMGYAIECYNPPTSEGFKTLSLIRAEYQAAERAARAARAAKTPVSAPVTLHRCDCGHSVPRSTVMNTSTGTACPECYDRMSA